LLRPVVFLIISLTAARLMAAATQPAYVDPQLCAQCHAEVTRNYALTGMGRSFRAVPANDASPEFSAAAYLHTASRELFSFARREGVTYIRRSQPGPDGAETNVFEERVDYVIGSGNHAISYLHRTLDNKLTEFPVSWYPENGGHWDMSPAYDRADHPGFSRELNFACLFCHNAYPASSLAGDAPGETVFPAQLPEGIDCQRCHGPGRNHVDAASQRKPLQDIRAAIVNPARLSSDRQSEVCLQCHLETTSSRLPASEVQPGRGIFSWRPGESLADFILYFDHAAGSTQGDSLELVSAPYRLAKSICVLANGKPLTCVTCHDPHLAVSHEESVAKTDRICASCHGARIVTLTAEGRHPTAHDCVTCHMPQERAADVIHASITDHWIRKPHATTSPRVEVNARNTPPYAGEVALYYPAALAPTADNSILLEVAQVQSNPVEALARLNALAADYRAERPEMAVKIGQAFLTLAQPQKALVWYRKAIEKSPDNWSYLSGAANAEQAAGRPDLAAESFVRAAALAPRETDSLLSLGQAYAKQGKFTDATRALRDAVGRNPESAAAWNDLGSTLLRAGTLPEAESALREAVRIQPEFASIRTNLADALIRQHKLSEAQEQLEEAIRIGGRGETAEAAWYATLLATGSAEQALKTWNASFAAQVAGAHNNLGTVFASEKKPDDAIREYRLAVAGDPRSELAQFNLGVTLFGRGLKTEAIPLLRSASESDDPGIRAAARSLLDQK
jgi:predicted CXXCH cytochrome family protein